MRVSINMCIYMYILVMIQGKVKENGSTKGSQLHIHIVVSKKTAEMSQAGFKPMYMYTCDCLAILVHGWCSTH